MEHDTPTTPELKPGMKLAVRTINGVEAINHVSVVVAVDEEQIWMSSPRGAASVLIQMKPGMNVRLMASQEGVTLSGDSSIVNVRRGQAGMEFAVPKPTTWITLTSRKNPRIAVEAPLDIQRIDPKTYKAERNVPGLLVDLSGNGARIVGRMAMAVNDLLIVKLALPDRTNTMPIVCVVVRLICDRSWLNASREFAVRYLKLAQEHQTAIEQFVEAALEKQNAPAPRDSEKPTIPETAA